MILTSSNTGIEQKLSVSDSSKASDSSYGFNCDINKAEFFDQISFLSVSCGLDLANPETEMDIGNLKSQIMKRNQIVRFLT